MVRRSSWAALRFHLSKEKQNPIAVKETKATVIRVLALIIFVGAWMETALTAGYLGLLFGWIPGFGLAYGFLFLLSLVDQKSE